MPSRIPSISCSKPGFIKTVGDTGHIPPLYLEIPYKDPHEVYPAFSGPMSFMLESAKGPPNLARYSYIGFSPYLTLKTKNNLHVMHARSDSGGLAEAGGPSRFVNNVSIRDSLSILGHVLQKYDQAPLSGLPPFQGGAAIVLGYDFVRYLEDIGNRAMDDQLLPDAHFLFIDRLIAFDQVDKRMFLIVCPGAADLASNKRIDWLSAYDGAESVLHNMRETMDKATAVAPCISRPGGSKVIVRQDMDEATYINMVRRAKEYIAAGDIFQANLSLRVSAEIGGIRPWDIYTVLRGINPSPFAAFMDMGDYAIASSSPERLVRVSDGIVETRPIAGTRPRGRDKAEDERLRAELLLNEKERAEHIMLIDLERNDIGKVCEYGSIGVDEFLTTEDYSHVMHIVSNIKGRLHKGKRPEDVIRAVFPGGTITGVPKVRCMQIIEELEPFRRGHYTGSLGYLGYGGCMDLNIIIRTFSISGGMAYVQAGAGIVADSEPAREYRESLKKAEALIKTIETFG